MLGDIENGVPGLYLLASYDIFSMLERVIFKNLKNLKKLKFPSK